jgi:hypothetical protein
MPTGKSILLLVASTLLFLPGIARAAEVDVQAGDVRTTIDEDGEVFVQAGQTSMRSSESNTPYYNRYRQHSNSRYYNRYRCYTDSRTYRSDRYDNYSDNVIHSQTSTTVCQ